MSVLVSFLEVVINSDMRREVISQREGDGESMEGCSIVWRQVFNGTVFVRQEGLVWKTSREQCRKGSAKDTKVGRTCIMNDSYLI